MKIALSMIWLASALCGCGTSLQFPHLKAPPSLPIPIELKGNYCTTWNKTGANGGGESRAIGVVCLQNTGSWQDIGTLVDHCENCGPYDTVTFPQLFAASAGSLGVGYVLKHAGPVGTMYTKTYDPVLKWQQIGGAAVNSDGKEEGTQYGPAYEWNNGKVATLWWSYGDQTNLSIFDRGSWSRYPVANLSSQRSYLAAIDNDLYIYTAQPSPGVWKWDGTAVIPVGTINSDPAQEHTFQSSLAKWSHYLVLAYTSEQPYTSWYVADPKTKVAFYDLNNPAAGWVVYNVWPEQTLGHDAVRPFLFVVNGELYVMYADYTTDGKPTAYNYLRHRFRVSHWNGSSWDRVGSESEALSHSEIFEFTLDTDKVLFSAIRAANGQGEQIVMGWQSGTFTQVGNVIASYASPFWWSERPGKVVALTQPTKKRR